MHRIGNLKKLLLALFVISCTQAIMAMEQPEENMLLESCLNGQKLNPMLSEVASEEKPSLIMSVENGGHSLLHQKDDIHAKMLARVDKLIDDNKTTNGNSLKKIDLNSKDATGKTFLHHAAARGFTDVVEGLVAFDQVNINAKDQASETPLFCAARNGHIDAVKFLVDCGANIFMMNNQGQLVFDVVKKLLENKDLTQNQLSSYKKIQNIVDVWQQFEDTAREIDQNSPLAPYSPVTRRGQEEMQKKKQKKEDREAVTRMVEGRKARIKKENKPKTSLEARTSRLKKSQSSHGITTQPNEQKPFNLSPELERKDEEEKPGIIQTVTEYAGYLWERRPDLFAWSSPKPDPKEIQKTVDDLVSSFENGTIHVKPEEAHDNKESKTPGSPGGALLTRMEKKHGDISTILSKIGISFEDYMVVTTEDTHKAYSGVVLMAMLLDAEESFIRSYIPIVKDSDRKPLTFQDIAWMQELLTKWFGEKLKPSQMLVKDDLERFIKSKAQRAPVVMRRVERNVDELMSDNNNNFAERVHDSYMKHVRIRDYCENKQSGADLLAQVAALNKAAGLADDAHEKARQEGKLAPELLKLTIMLLAAPENQEIQAFLNELSSDDLKKIEVQLINWSSSCNASKAHEVLDPIKQCKQRAEKEAAAPQKPKKKLQDVAKKVIKSKKSFVSAFTLPKNYLNEYRILRLVVEDKSADYQKAVIQALVQDNGQINQEFVGMYNKFFRLMFNESEQTLLNRLVNEAIKELSSPVSLDQIVTADNNNKEEELDAALLSLISDWSETDDEDETAKQEKAQFIRDYVIGNHYSFQQFDRTVRGEFGDAESNNIVTAFEDTFVQEKVTTKKLLSPEERKKLAQEIATEIDSTMSRIDHVLSSDGESRDKEDALAMLIDQRGSLEKVIKPVLTLSEDKKRKNPAYKALVRYVSAGNLDEVKKILAQNKDINVNAPRNGLGDTLLHVAIRSEYPNNEVIEYLIAYGIDVNAPNNAASPQTPLQLALDFYNRTQSSIYKKIIEMLIRAGAQRDLHTPEVRQLFKDAGLVELLEAAHTVEHQQMLQRNEQPHVPVMPVEVPATTISTDQEPVVAEVPQERQIVALNGHNNSVDNTVKPFEEDATRELINSIVGLENAHEFDLMTECLYELVSIAQHHAIDFGSFIERNEFNGQRRLITQLLEHAMPGDFDTHIEIVINAVSKNEITKQYTASLKVLKNAYSRNRYGFIARLRHYSGINNIINAVLTDTHVLDAYLEMQALQDAVSMPLITTVPTNDTQVEPIQPVVKKAIQPVHQSNDQAINAPNFAAFGLANAPSAADVLAENEWHLKTILVGDNAFEAMAILDGRLNDESQRPLVLHALSTFAQEQIAELGQRIDATTYPALTEAIATQLSIIYYNNGHHNQPLPTKGNRHIDSNNNNQIQTQLETSKIEEFGGVGLSAKIEPDKPTLSQDVKTFTLQEEAHIRKLVDQLDALLINPKASVGDVLKALKDIEQKKLVQAAFEKFDEKEIEILKKRLNNASQPMLSSAVKSVAAFVGLGVEQVKGGPLGVSGNHVPSAQPVVPHLPVHPVPGEAVHAVPDGGQAIANPGIWAGLRAGLGKASQRMKIVLPVVAAGALASYAAYNIFESYTTEMSPEDLLSYDIETLFKKGAYKKAYELIVEQRAYRAWIPEAGTKVKSLVAAALLGVLKERIAIKDSWKALVFGVETYARTIDMNVWYLTEIRRVLAAEQRFEQVVATKAAPAA